MKNFFPFFHNKLASFSSQSSLLFTLFCIHLLFSPSVFVNSTNQNSISQSIILKFDIITDILNGLLEGYGSWTNTILPSESSSSSSPSTQEPSIKPDSNLESDKGSDKFVIISLLFLVLMLIPYLSDSSINESILPFIMVFKRSIKLPSLSSILSETSKDKLIFTFFTLLILSITTINILPISETSNIESILISVSFFAKIKDRIIPSRPSTPDSFSDASLDRALDKEYSRLDGNYPNLERVQEIGSRASTVTNIEYSGSVLDISRDSERYSLSETSENANIEHNICSTCPSVGSSSTLDSSVSTTISMIESIRNEEVSSINVEHTSMIASSGISTESAPTAETSLSAQGHIGSDIAGTVTIRQTDSLLSSESVVSSTVESENSMDFDPAFLSYRDAQRARTLHYLTTPRDTKLSEEGWKEFASGLQLDSNSISESFIPFLFIITNCTLYKKLINSKLFITIINSKLIQNVSKSETYMYCKSSLLIKTILTIMLSFALKHILNNIFLILILPLWDFMLPLVSQLGNIILLNISETYTKLGTERVIDINITSDNLIIFIYILIPALYLFWSHIIYMFINNTIKKLLLIILQLFTVMFIDMNTFNLLTPNSISLDSSISSSSNSSNICNRLVNFINNLFKIKIKTVYAPLPDAERLAEEDDYDSLASNGINPYSTLPSIKGNSTSLETAKQQAKVRSIEDDQWNKDQSMWFNSDSEPLRSDSDQSTSSLLVRVRSNSIRNKVKNWLKSNNQDQASNDTSNDDSIWLD